ncbi:hypothetical protein AX17_005650 [Amanita inopinata Kibby_2008]|nr:hypothetical protein AX17_005650 [Amanita inopinata Kibby_2008]
MASVVHKFPPEIVCEVFSHFSAWMPVHDPSLFPWYLGQICRAWRTIFISKPTFWSHIDVNLGSIHQTEDSDHHRYGRALDLVKLCMQRSNGQPISFIYRNLRHSSTFSALEYSHKILQLLVTESTRWLHVRISLSYFDYEKLCPIEGRLPLLRSLQFSQETAFTSVPGSCQNVFRDARALTSIHLRYLSTWRFNWSSLAWISVETVHLDKVDELQDALRQAVLLEGLLVMQCPVEPADNQLRLLETLPVITLPHLVYLSIPHACLLRFLKAPALVHLCLRDDDLYDAFFDTVTSFLKTSACSVRKLEVSACYATDAIGILQYTPKLVHLELKDIRPALDDAFARLVYGIEDNTGLTLQHLQLIVVKQSPHTREEIVRLCTILLAGMHRAVDCARSISDLRSKIEEISQLCQQNREVLITFDQTSSGGGNLTEAQHS